MRGSGGDPATTQQGNEREANESKRWRCRGGNSKHAGRDEGQGARRIGTRKAKARSDERLESVREGQVVLRVRNAET